MRIGFDAVALVGSGGNSRYSKNLLQAIKEIDRANQYILFGYAHDWVRGREVSPAYLSPLGLPIPELLIKKAQTVLARIQTKRQGIDLWHFTNPLNVIPGIRPYVVTIHDLAPLHNPLWVKEHTVRFFERRIKDIILGAARVIAVSEYTKQDIVSRFAISPEKIIVTPEAADNHFYPDADRAFVKETYQLDNFILYAGQIQERKNVSGLIAAYHELDEALRRQYPLVIVGGAPSEAFLERLKKQVGTLGLNEQVKFLGRVPDDTLRKLYSSAKLFIYPSFFEGFGLPPLESIACGTPAIVSQGTSLVEVVGDA
ncbi:MAG: glycosyltransferase family 1 protein, partial [Patescibacteria group bacterium]